MRTYNWLGDWLRGFLLAVFCPDFAQLLKHACFRLRDHLRGQLKGHLRGRLHVRGYFFSYRYAIKKNSKYIAKKHSLNCAPIYINGYVL